MRPHVVVGIDGARPSQRALVFALHAARLRGAIVDAVIAWHEPYGGSRLGLSVSDDPAVYARSASETLERTLRNVRADYWGPPVERHVGRGSPADVLLAAAADAALLVVGSRGRGGLTGVLLGSVAQQLVRDATCPVVVVPAPRPRPHRRPRLGVALAPR